MSDSINNEADRVLAESRRVRVFISSTFRDMMAERDALMSHAWPELRRFCRERHVEFVEVDMRWGITEEQSTRKETLKLCLDEIRYCRPYFIGLIGERYGWVPGSDAFTADLKEEQPWIVELDSKSVTELEILHGVLNNLQMANRAFFYFREPSFSLNRGPDYQSENIVAAQKLDDLKKRILNACNISNIQLHDNYADPTELSKLVVDHLKSAIDKQFPKEEIPDSLTREATSQQSFVEILRRSYIGRAEYYRTLDKHTDSDSAPLVVSGDSGSGKSALLANWLAHWKKIHPDDYIFQHYIGSTPESADHWHLMKRLMAEIKKWSGDPAALPTSHDEITRDFPLWLAKARLKAEHDSVRFLLILDGINQLKDQGNSHKLGWLPQDAFTGQLHLIVSTLPGESFDLKKKYRCHTLHVEGLKEYERRLMIVYYLKKFSKSLDHARMDRIIASPATANPLYLKILLDELRITGTYDMLDERLRSYLVEPDIPSLLRNVLGRCQRQYEKDRKDLVKDALSLIWSARRGLSESELLQVLRPVGLGQLPHAVWNPLRAAIEELLIDRGGILNFAHDFIRAAVKEAYIPRQENQDRYRLQLADYFEAMPPSTRSCDELPWLLQKTRARNRLRTCLLRIDCFREIFERDKLELREYWIGLGEQTVMGKAYLESFEKWSNRQDITNTAIGYNANNLSNFLFDSALYADAEFLMHRVLHIHEETFGIDHPMVATQLNNLAALLAATNRINEAEPLYRRALSIREKHFGDQDPEVARYLNNIAALLQETNRIEESEQLYRRALSIDEKNYGKNHPNFSRGLNNLARVLHETNRMVEAETCMRRSLSIDEKFFGKNHPDVARDMNNLAGLLHETNRTDEAELFYRKALDIYEKCFGNFHPNVARSLNNIASLLQKTKRLNQAESLYRRALSIDEKNFGGEHPIIAKYLNNIGTLLQEDNRLDEAEQLYRRALSIDEKNFGTDHPETARDVGNLAALLHASNRLDEAEPFMHRALSNDERNYGKEHPKVAISLNNLAQLLQDSNRMDEAEPLMHRQLKIFITSSRKTGHQHPHLQTAVENYANLLRKMGYNHQQRLARLHDILS